MPPMYICKKCGTDVGHWNIFCDDCLEKQSEEVIKEQNDRIRKIDIEVLKENRKWEANNKKYYP